MKKLLLVGLALIVLLVIGLAVAVRLLIDPERVRATIAAQASAALDLPVTVEAAAVSIWPRARLTLSGVKVGEPERLSLQSIEIATALGALLSRRIENAELDVADSTVDLSALMTALAGLDAGPAPAAATPTDAPLTIVNVRTISFRNVRLLFDGGAATVSLESALDGDRLDIGSFELASAVTTLKASGAVESLTARRAKLSVTADPLDLDGMIAMLASSQGPASKPEAASAFAEAPADRSVGQGAGGPIDLTLDVTAAAGRAAGVEFRDLKTTVRVTERGITLEPFGLGLFAGRVEGKGHVDLTRAEPAMAIDVTLTAVDMSAVAAHAGQPRSISGRLGGTLHLAGAGPDPAAALATATGRGTLAITDGAIPNLHLVRAIVLAFGKPAQDLPGGGDAFSRIGATMQLANDVVRFTDLRFESRDVDVTGAGTLALAGGAIQVVGRAMLSEALTAQAGRDLIRVTAENNRVTVPVTITGRISDPRVGVDAAGVLRRAASNEVQSQIKKQTGGLLDRLRGKKKP